MVSLFVEESILDFLLFLSPCVFSLTTFIFCNFWPRKYYPDNAYLSLIYTDLLLVSIMILLLLSLSMTTDKFPWFWLMVVPFTILKLSLFHFSHISSSLKILLFLISKIKLFIRMINFLSLISYLYIGISTFLCLYLQVKSWILSCL